MKLRILNLCVLLALTACGSSIDDQFKNRFYPQTNTPSISIAGVTPVLPVTIGVGITPDTGATVPVATFPVPQLVVVPVVDTPAAVENPVVAPIVPPTPATAVIPTPAPVVVLLPVSIVPDPNPLSVNTTGALGIEDNQEPVILAQYVPQQPPGYYEPRVMGLDAAETIVLQLPKPPLEATPCEDATIVFAPIMAAEHQYNNWWLLASLTNTKTFVQFNQAQFYWATQISEQEIAIVPTGVVLGPDRLKNVRIDAGFAVLSYQLINVLQVLRKFPTNPDEPCIG